MKPFGRLNLTGRRRLIRRMLVGIVNPNRLRRRLTTGDGAGNSSARPGLGVWRRGRDLIAWGGTALPESSIAEIVPSAYGHHDDAEPAWAVVEKTQVRRYAGDDDDVGIARVAVAELIVGVKLASGRRQAARQAYVDDVVGPLPIIAYDMGVAAEHPELLAAVREEGRARCAHDLIIAATAELSIVRQSVPARGPSPIFLGCHYQASVAHRESCASAP